MSAFHLNADTFRVYYDKIVRYKPRFIVAFPSNAFLLAKLINENKLPVFPSLKAVICSSENMYDWQRDYMQDVFQVRVFSYYGHSEKAALAVECHDSTNYEFYPQYGFVELINENDEPCTHENERGEIVVTGFNNYAAPFIRYKTSDIGIYTKNHSKKHPNWLTIKRIEGRKQDFLIDKDNTPKTAIHIDRPFWNLRDIIYAYQYIQHKPGMVLLTIHAKQVLTEAQLAQIRNDFFSAYFKFELEIKQVDGIPRTKSGKFKYLVQHIKDV
jgi:phenylacetate-CoA ligase